MSRQLETSRTAKNIVPKSGNISLVTDCADVKNEFPQPALEVQAMPSQKLVQESTTLKPTNKSILEALPKEVIERIKVQ